MCLRCLIDKGPLILLLIKMHHIADHDQLKQESVQ